MIFGSEQSSSFDFDRNATQHKEKGNHVICWSIEHIPIRTHFQTVCAIAKIKTGMEILISIASKIAEYLVAPVGQWLCYSFHYDDNIKNMTDRVNNLGATRDGMQNRVKAAENNVENIAADVYLWLKEVDDIMEKAKEVLEADKEKKNSSQGACLNLKQRHKHSKTAKKMLLEIDKLLKNVNFDHFSQRPASQDLVTSTYTDYMPFNSRMSIMEELMEALGDTAINLIGVWGMPGVGKSTLVNEVAKKVKEEKLFDEVAISIVKQNSSLKQIQTEISDALDLRLDKETLGESKTSKCEVNKRQQ